MGDRIVYLANLSRALTDEEYEEFSAYFETDENEHGPIGGPDHPIAGLLDDEDCTAASNSNFEPDSDHSDLEGPFADAEPLEDARYTELVADIENADLTQSQEVQEINIAVEPKRGQKYIGQGKQDKKVWWSMPSPSEDTRASNMKELRSKSIPTCTLNFTSKKEAFEAVFPKSIVDCIVLETNRKAKRTYENPASGGSCIKKRPWRDTTADEIYAFIGVVIYAGAEKSNLVHAKDLF